MSRISSWSSTVGNAFDPDRAREAGEPARVPAAPDDRDDDPAPPVAVVAGTSSELFRLFASAATDAQADSDDATARNAWLEKVDLPQIKVEFQSDD